MSLENNAVIGAALGYSSDQVRLFLSTLRESGYNGKIYLFTNDATSIDQSFAEDLNVKLLMTRVPTNANVGKLVTVRYWLLQEFLKSEQSLDKIFFSDVRDVLFQNDPFNFAGWDRYSLFYALEEKVIGDCGMNARWISTRYGQGVLRSMMGEVVSCCGTIFARHNQLLEYVGKMCNHLSDAPDVYGMDTGVHNFIIRKDPIAGQKALLNGLGPVMTIHHMTHSRIPVNDDGLFQNYDGSTPVVVHQYDRLSKAVARKFRALS